MNDINKKIDYFLICILLGLSLLSILSIYSALPMINSNYSSMTILLKQIMWYILGFALLIGLYKLGNDRIEMIFYIMYYVLLFLLALLIIQSKLNLPFLSKFIKPINNSYCWYTIPGFGTLQPSEFMKIVLVVIVAKIIDDHHKNFPSPTLKSDIIMIKNILMYVLPPCFLIYIQPDSGLVLIILFSTFFMIIVSGLRKEWFIIGFSLVIALLSIIYIIYLVNPDFVINKIIGGQYKINRIYGWLYPEQYIQSYGTQLYTSLLAIGSAGIFGHGLQNVPIYISESQTDFIFAIICSSFGLVGGLTAIFLNLMLDIHLIIVGIKTRLARNKYIIGGLLGILLFQQIENMGMIIGLLPITGITLPFVSAGGSSLLSYYIILSLVLNMYNDVEKKEENAS